MPPTNEFQINEVFWTLQGEGHFTGRRALFIRLPFCNYNCPWCDTEYDSYTPWTREKLLQVTQQESARFAVITGGEPLAHKHLPAIVDLLKEQDFFVACETNASFAPHPKIDFVTTSPKGYTKNKFEPYYIHPEIRHRTQEWKYVVDKKFDFAILQRHQDDPNDVYLSLSPEYGDMKANTQRILDYIKDHPRWRLSLQTHKWIDIP